MFLGVCYKDSNKTISQNEIYQAFSKTEKAGGRKLSTYFDGPLGFGFQPESLPARSPKEGFHLNSEQTHWVALFGNIFNFDELSRQVNDEDGKDWARFLFPAYLKWGPECFFRINGNFVAVIWDRQRQKLIFCRDHLGIEPLYYFEDGEKIVLGSSIKVLLQHQDIKPEINYQGLYSYLLFNYNPGLETLIANVKKLRPGHYLELEKGQVQIKRYWYLSYAQNETSSVQNETKDEESYKEELLSLLRDTIRVRLENNGQSHGAFLSGGMDSSSVVGLMSAMVDTPIHTFSFRCQGKSFDESHYAQIVSAKYHTQHHLVEFLPEEVTTISNIVENMDEPFCDIGIEIASYILGRTAHGKTNYVLTGDGGDELFAGHPVYLADRVAQKFEKVPRWLQRPLTKALQFLPDTDKKKSLIVKAKRFSYSFNFPKELYSNRWRIYYTKNELQRLCKNDLVQEFEGLNPLDEIMELYREADGPDYLSKTLYGDYHTVVGFYLRRMQLLRAFGIEGRFPLLDHRLVEYAATIPSELKIKNGSETKYILHKTMAGILPDEIVYRKDKLGHSVPMKNWMRESPAVQELIFDVLSETTVNKRGYFNNAYIQSLISQHLNKSHNHSHRLWALVVLELWLQKNVRP